MVPYLSSLLTSSPPSHSPNSTTSSFYLFIKQTGKNKPEIIIKIIITN